MRESFLCLFVALVFLIMYSYSWLSCRFTSAPIPTEYYYQGSIGNDATCTAQGFFIQVGTVAAYCNVSLAFYYYLLITKGMNDSRIRPFRLWFFICPIVLGMAFAFAGKFFYNDYWLAHVSYFSQLNNAFHRFALLWQFISLVVSIEPNINPRSMIKYSQHSFIASYLLHLITK